MHVTILNKTALCHYCDLPGGWEPLCVDSDTVLVARPLLGQVLVFFLKEAGHLRGSEVRRLHATRLLLEKNWFHTLPFFFFLLV